ncbi:MAG: glucosaminidase domain-containing protein [Acidimicrobiia bacterium]
MKHRPFATVLTVAIVAALAVAGLGVLGATPAHAEAVNPILGGARLTPTEIAAWYNAVKTQRDATTKKNGGVPTPYRATVSVDQLAQLFVDEGYRYNVRGDIAFAQSVLETGYFEFPDSGQVRPTDNNFAGIGACNSCNGGYKWADARTGVRAQVQHLRNYADATSKASALPDPPILPNFDTFKYKGAAPNWEDLNGKWAVPGTTYGQKIIGIFTNMLTYAGVSLSCPPDAPLGSLQTAGKGYWMAAADGGVFAFGSAKFYGSAGNVKLNQPMIDLAATAGGGGYWLLAKDGGIFAYGDAQFYGSTGAMRLNQPIVGMASTPAGHGYWLVAKDGGIFAFGDAQFYGSTGAMRLNQPIVGMASTQTGHGYWLVAKDGGIFAFGDAQFYGSTGAMRLNQPIVGIAPNAGGDGYWLAAADGGIFSFGNARYLGGLAGCTKRTVLGIQASPTGKGYYLNSAEGRVATFGDARHWGWPFTTNVAPLALAVMG